MRTNRRKLTYKTYEKLEYIANTNGGWILTNLYLTSKSTLNIKVQLLIKSVSSFCGSTELFNANDGWITKNAIGLGISQLGNGFRFFWGSGDINTPLSNIATEGCIDTISDIKLNRIYNLSIANNMASVDGVKVATLKNVEFETKYPFSIFQISRSIPFVSSKQQRIYDLKIGGDLNAHFIPVKRNDGVIGMYDLVGKKFYTSPNGVAFSGGVKSKVFIASLFESAMAERRVA